MHVERAFVSHSRRTCNNSTETFFFWENFSPFLSKTIFSSVRKTKKEREKEEDEEVKEEEEEKLVLWDKPRHDSTINTMRVWLGRRLDESYILLLIGYLDARVIIFVLE